MQEVDCSRPDVMCVSHGPAGLCVQEVLDGGARMRVGACRPGQATVQEYLGSIAPRMGYEAGRERPSLEWWQVSWMVCALMVVLVTAVWVRSWQEMAAPGEWDDCEPEAE
jgi:hypothetical protein